MVDPRIEHASSMPKLFINQFTEPIAVRIMSQIGNIVIALSKTIKRLLLLKGSQVGDDYESYS